MAKLNGGKTGIALGILFALIHLVWVVAIAISRSGMQNFMDWIFNLHHIQMDMAIQAFNLGNSAILILIAFVTGYILGEIFALIFNKFSR